MLVDYLPLILTLIGAVIAVRGYTWDDEKKKITVFGKIVITISFLSFLITLYTIHEKNEEISDAKKIKYFAYTQIHKGVEALLSPLLFDNKNIDSPNFYNKIKDTFHLAQLYKKSILNNLNNSGGLKIGEFDHYYQFDSAAIQKGENLLNDAILKYNTYLDAKTIIYISEILADTYYNSRYKLNRGNYFVQIAKSFLNDSTKAWAERLNPPYSSYDFYYNTGDSKGSHKYDKISDLIKKIEDLDEHIQNRYKH